MLLIQFAPAWAEGKHRPKWAEPGSWKPKPNALADFGTALAKRYSGHYPGPAEGPRLPLLGRGEPAGRLTPLWGGKNGKKPVAPLHYKKMLNAFYDAVHAVSASNNVVSAAVGPLRRQARAGEHAAAAVVADRCCASRTTSG